MASNADNFHIWRRHYGISSSKEYSSEIQATGQIWGVFGEQWYILTITYIYDLLLKVWLMGCATSFICFDWYGKGRPMVACPFRALVFLYRMLPIFTLYETFNVWSNVSTIVYLSRVFLPFLLTDFLFEKRIGQVSMDLLYIIFTYYTQDNQHGCFGLSNSLWCLGPWMNHLPPVWLSNFGFIVLNES